MSDKENDLIREDTVTEPEADAAAAADNAEGAERDAAPSEPETAKSGKKSNKPREKFSVWFKRNRKKILLSLTAILSLGAVLAVILVPTHFATLNEPGDFIDLPVARLSLDSAVTVEKSGSYIAHPDSVWVDDGSEQGKIIVMYPLGHGKGQIAMRVSYDMGLTWSDRVTGLPASFADSQETPTLYNLHFTDGSEKLVMISGCPYWVATKYKADGFNFSFSDDYGETWSEFEKFHSPADAIVAMSSLTQIKENGQYIDKWMGLFHDHSFNVYKTYLTFDEDGNADWSAPELLMLRRGDAKVRHVRGGDSPQRGQRCAHPHLPRGKEGVPLPHRLLLRRGRNLGRAERAPLRAQWRPPQGGV